MTPAVVAKFEAFLIACGEGCLPWLYLDELGLVTTGVGNMLPDVVSAMALSWVWPDGTPASTSDVRAAWYLVTSRKDLAGKGGSVFRNLTNIRLTQASIDKLVAQKAAAFEKQLRPSFPGYDDQPDAAQEGILRLAWATGGADFAKRWPHFTAAFNARDWAACAAQCRIPRLDVTEPKANELEAQLFESLVAA